jgi:zinc transport system substrate-binding protein
MKKNLLAALLCFALAAALLIGCGQPEGKEPENGESGEAGIKRSVIATVFPPYDFARQIAGENADVAMLLPPASESHSFEPTPKDIIRIQNCDVFIYVGGESDEWVRGVLESMDTSKMKIVTLMDCVETVEEEIVEGMEAEEQTAGEGHELDEHVWTSPRNAKLIAQKIAAALCEADAANAESYKANASAYEALLDDLDAKFQSVVGAAARKTIVFGDRFPFRYFADAYGLDYFAAFPGCSTETEASAATVKFIIDKVKSESIPAVFYIELSNALMAETICEATGAKALLLHSCHNITRDDFLSGKTYVELMAANVEALREALR